MRERIQKVLAMHGVGSRRQVEGWIAAGRLTVNGRPATAGQAIAARDDVRLDGRRLRLERASGAPHQGIAYHRPAEEQLRPRASGSAPSSIERLPKSGGRRWIPVSPLGARDGGLEVFLTDGALAAALTRRGVAIPSEYSVRVRGATDESELARMLASRVDIPGAATFVVTPAGGEGSNRWLQVEAVGLRPRDLRQIFEQCGLDANRILRTRFGPVVMDRRLARGRSRPLTDGELKGLQEAARAQSRDRSIAR